MSAPVIRPGHFKTLSGNYLSVQEPDATAIPLGDVVVSLAHTCRFGGQLWRPYYVAQHCVLAARLAEKRGSPVLSALAHDFAESVIGDMIAPIKHLDVGLYREYQAGWDRAFESLFSLAPKAFNYASVRSIDHDLYIAEDYDLRDGSHARMLGKTRSPDIPRIKPWGIKRCRRELVRAIRYCSGVPVSLPWRALWL